MHEDKTTEPSRSVANEFGSVAIETQAAAEFFCDQFHETMDILRDAIESETRHLKEMKFSELEILQSKKLTLSRTYSNGIKTFATNANEIKRLVPAHVEALRENHQFLRAAIVENQQFLGIVKDVSQSLIRRTAERVANANQPKSYNASATGKSTQQVAAVACDRML